MPCCARPRLEHIKSLSGDDLVRSDSKHAFSSSTSSSSSAELRPSPEPCQTLQHMPTSTEASTQQARPRGLRKSRPFWEIQAEKKAALAAELEKQQNAEVQQPQQKEAAQQPGASSSTAELEKQQQDAEAERPQQKEAAPQPAGSGVSEAQRAARTPGTPAPKASPSKDGPGGRTPKTAKKKASETPKKRRRPSLSGTPKKMGSPFFASPFRRQRRPRRSKAQPSGVGFEPTAEALALLKLHEADLEATRPQRDALVEQFVVATASILSDSPLREHFLRLGMCADPMLKHVAMDDQMLVEFRSWLPSRQHSALRLLCYNPFVTSVILNGCALEDGAGGVLAEVLYRSKSITSLSVERNDLREPGLLALVNTLRTNATLRELRINHQRFTVTTPVEEALHEILHGGHNSTLCKLGLIVRNDVPRNRIEAALMRNIDRGRAARQREATRRRSEGGGGSGRRRSHGGGGVLARSSASLASLASIAMGGGGLTGDHQREGRPPVKRRQLSQKLAEFAVGLEGALAVFDVEGLVVALANSQQLPPGLTSEIDGSGAGGATGRPAGIRGVCLNLNNDVKFARCTAEQKEAVIRALCSNTTVAVVEMANVQLTDAAANAWADVLMTNTRIKSVNLEGNLIGSQGISSLAGAVEHSALVELKLDHQVGAVCSATAELELARGVDKLRTLQRFSYSMRNVQSRDLVERAMMRNRDQLRLQRVSTRRMLEAGAQAGQLQQPAEYAMPALLEA